METTAVKPATKDSGSGGGRSSGSGGGPPGRGRSSGTGGGLFEKYKPELGRYTRVGTFVGALALVAWGAYFLNGQLSVYEGDEAWRLMVTPGIPLLLAVVLGTVAWWLSFSYRKSSDFMIATEGEMKKVSWSSKRELIGSTKVVILFTVLLAVFLFVADVLFQALFSWIGVLKT